jgi:two-component system, chemotaxis family, response regulator PixG
MNNSGTFTKLRSLSLLRQLSNSSESTDLQVLSNSISWSIYLDQGRITYATHSVEPFDRLERHLRRLSHQTPLLQSEIRVQLRLMFEPDLQNRSKDEGNLRRQPPEHQAISWLVNQRYLNTTQAAVLIQELVKEVIESFLLIKEGTYQLLNVHHKLPVFCRFDVGQVTEYCQGRLNAWQSLTPDFSSPYQRPYLLISTKTQQKNLPELQQNLTSWMKGFSLRHLAVIMNQDELQLARSLHPYILNGSILLHEPDPPFDKLPKIFENLLHKPNYIREVVNKNQLAIPAVGIAIPQQISQTIAPQKDTPPREVLQQLTSDNIESTPQKVIGVTSSVEAPRRLYKIVSVDDSPTILKEISRFLEDESFSVVTINDPLKAVMSVIRNKPDLILLDLNMEGLDGYELCRLIRNNSMFKDTPIIMVTGNRGFVDKVRARMVGASGYLTKPFTRAELLKIVFMHLT